MTAAIMALALALAGAVVAIVYLARQNVTTAHEYTMVNKLWTDEKAVAETYLAQRNAGIAKNAELESLNTGLKMRVAALQQEVSRAEQKASEQIVERLKASNVADASRLLDELLQAPILPGLPKAAQAGTGRPNGG